MCQRVFGYDVSKSLHIDWVEEKTLVKENWKERQTGNINYLRNEYTKCGSCERNDRISWYSNYNHQLIKGEEVINGVIKFNITSREPV